MKCLNSYIFLRISLYFTNKYFIYILLQNISNKNSKIEIKTKHVIVKNLSA